MATLHARLRNATAPAHRRLESSLNLPEAGVQPVGIIRLLERFHGFHATWEPQLPGLVPDHLLVPRLKLPLLQEDLQCLGASSDDLRALPRCPDAPALCRCPASAAGALYVLEGSTLGGRVISRRLQAAGWHPAQRLRYWDPYGADTGRRWLETLAYLESLPPGWSGAVIASAIATFGVLQTWLPPADLREDSPDDDTRPC